MFVGKRDPRDNNLALSPTTITCNLDPAYIGNNIANGLDELTESLTIVRTLSDSTVETISAGNVSFKKLAKLEFQDPNNLSPAAPFDFYIGPNAGTTAGFWHLDIHGVLILDNPFATFQLTNTGVGTVTNFKFSFNGTEYLIFKPGPTDCGNIGYASGYYYGTLNPGQTCTFSVELQLYAQTDLSGCPAVYDLMTSHQYLNCFPTGSTLSYYDMNVLARVWYDDNTGTQKSVQQKIHPLYSN